VTVPIEAKNQQLGDIIYVYWENGYAYELVVYHKKAKAPCFVCLAIKTEPIPGLLTIMPGNCFADVIMDDGILIGHIDAREIYC